MSGPAVPDWPYAAGGPLLAVALRTVPDDFRVDEELGFEAGGDGEHDLLRVQKTGVNTEWLARQLARHAGVAVVDVGYCGLKDRHAVTTQYFSVRRPNRDGTDWTQFEVPGVRVLACERHHRKLRRGAHSANRFRIVARAAGIGRAAAAIEARWSQIAADGVPNYFGEQRFGRHAGNLELARRLFAGARLRREQRNFALSAARAFLFNRIAAARVLDGSWNRLLPGERVNLDGSDSVFYADQVTPELAARCAGGDLNPTATLWGEGAPLGRGAVAELERAAVAADPDLAAGLERSRTAATHRPLRVRPVGTGAETGDDCAVLHFRLPPGAFATTVLRELFRVPEDPVP